MFCDPGTEWAIYSDKWSGITIVENNQKLEEIIYEKKFDNSNVLRKFYIWTRRK